MAETNSNPVLSDYRERILQLAKTHGAQNVRVFGSLARDEGGSESDLDLLVRLGEGRSLFDIIALKHELEDMMHRPVDVVTDGSLSPYLRERVLREAVPL